MHLKYVVGITNVAAYSFLDPCRYMDGIMRMLISKIHKESGLRKYDLKHQRITVSVTVAVILFE